MELVRGKTLDQIIGNRGLSVNESLRYAIPIADALARAHAAGILHLDLKPSNIMITQDGVPKVLDFGIARLAQPQAVADGDATLTQGASQLGQNVVAGTAAYMSPEQAQGKELDVRSDIFSFGAVLYEMITGRSAFRGDSTVSTLSAVLDKQPEPLTRLAPQVPRELERIIQRCLRKDPSRRFQSMGDVKVELEEVREESESRVQPVQAPARRKRRTWIYVVAAAASLAIVAGAWWLRKEIAPTSPPSLPVPLTAYQGDQDDADFSPDGSQVVFEWDGEHRDKFHIYVKPVASANYLQLTKGDTQECCPKWSPDGQWIAFERGDGTKWRTFMMSPIGGNERTLRDGTCRGLSWSSDSKALACGTETGIILISAETGEVRQLTSPSKGQWDLFPAFSPDGKKLLFGQGIGQSDDFDLYLLDLNSDLSAQGKPRRITMQHTNHWGGLAWTADSREAIWSMSINAWDLSLYRVLIAGSGHIEPLVFGGSQASSPAVSRRANRLAYTRWSDVSHIWRTDGHASERHPVSSTEIEISPQYSPDGKHIVLDSNRSGSREVWVANSDGSEPVQLTHFGRHCGTPHWSPDGRWIAFDADSANGGKEIWVVDSSGGKPRQVTNGPGISALPSFSHDGKWIYFNNDRTGRREVFRIAFAVGAAEQLTHDGGGAVYDSFDGKTLYYLKNDRTAYSAPLYEAPATGGQERPLGIDVAKRAFQVIPMAFTS